MTPAAATTTQPGTLSQKRRKWEGRDGDIISLARSDALRNHHFSCRHALRPSNFFATNRQTLQCRSN